MLQVLIQIRIQTQIEIHKEIETNTDTNRETNQLANGLLEVQRCTDSRLRPQFLFSGNLTPTISDSNFMLNLIYKYLNLYTFFLTFFNSNRWCFLSKHLHLRVKTFLHYASFEGKLNYENWRNAWGKISVWLSNPDLLTSFDSS